ncbi:MAG: aspartyl/asparaginyl beta-hydroxylase domain-containing protein [Kibdelosporangium sp.]
MLGSIEIDADRLADDIRTSSALEFGDPYIEFNCGHPWKSCMIWAGGGETGDGILINYDNSLPCLPTANGRKLPYVQEMIERYFTVEHLLYGRLVIMSNNVLIPHRDYREFAGRPADQKAAHRLHIPLDTTPDALFMAGSAIYRMRVGEIWSLDVTELHSAAVLSDYRRLHLILDFAEVEHQADLVTFDFDESTGIPENSLATRPELTRSAQDAILGMSGLITMDNYMDVFGIVIKKQFRATTGESYAWDTMREISDLSGNPEIVARTKEFYEHCVRRPGE